VTLKKRGRPRKSEAAVVDTAYRRSTRSCSKRDGCRPVSMSDTAPRSKKKVKVQKKKVEEAVTAMQDIATVSAEQPQQQHSDDNAVQIPPETPVHIMQNVGIALGIDPDMLTEERLKADPKGKKNKDGLNDS
jgi:hypothetical protein